MGRSTPTTALIEQFDTLRIQCRHIEHMHEGVYNFCLAQIPLKSSFQNFGLLVLTITCQVFSLNLTVPEVSNKHCLLTFFIFAETLHEGRAAIDMKHIKRDFSLKA